MHAIDRVLSYSEDKGPRTPLSRLMILVIDDPLTAEQVLEVESHTRLLTSM